MTGSKQLGPVMVDVAGHELTDDEIRRIKHFNTGGVILFARNFVSRAQLTGLTQKIHQVRPGILIAVDHEGGRVQRFKTDGFTHLPAMRQLGQYWDKSPQQAERLATSVGYVLASELRACGVDLSFTPVLDLDYGQSAVVGNRAFHSSPAVVTSLAKSLMHGLLLTGMANCGKHFPGHGFAEADSHVAMPVDTRSLEDILSRDAMPYGLLEGSLASVMPAHVVYTNVDSQPAGFSKKWLSILRKNLGFTGVIFSDDLSMQGARHAGTVTDAANAALYAGCDMVLVCNAPSEADQVLMGLDVPASWNESSIRLQRLLPTAPALTWDELQEDARYRQAKLNLVELAGV